LATKGAGDPVLVLQPVDPTVHGTDASAGPAVSVVGRERPCGSWVVRPSPGRSALQQAVDVAVLDAAEGPPRCRTVQDGDLEVRVAEGAVRAREGADRGAKGLGEGPSLRPRRLEAVPDGLGLTAQHLPAGLVDEGAVVEDVEQLVTLGRPAHLGDE